MHILKKMKFFITKKLGIIAVIERVYVIVYFKNKKRTRRYNSYLLVL